MPSPAIAAWGPMPTQGPGTIAVKMVLPVAMIQAATPEAAAIGAVVEATLGAAVTSAVISSLSGQHEKPTRTRVGFSVSTAYHDLMPTDPNCPMCQTVAELERDGRADLIWRFPHSIAVVGPWQFYTG